ncbi:hypothetical protein HB364_31425 [Pseudoflavitalea sp. X16]|uniref:hypothetical protein n=1 Tax=Paraflavitalea devenefica TaxID=2716334 RepID=UPI0014205C09|nr:hypothetical protein [Paraflavitalea devenefica]NII29632.1 hypothetical protein [Paraflavitalea devenefica]
MKVTATTFIPAGYRSIVYRRLLKRASLLPLLIIGSAITVMISCKKDKHDPAPPPAEKVLQVNFGASSIAWDLVDSGFVVFKREGATSQVFKRFEKKTHALSFSMDDLSAGNWTAEMYIFTRYNQSAGRRYRQDKAFIVPTGGAKQGITLPAPTGAVTDSWKPYAFFRHEGTGVSIAVALDNKDPHFDIQVRDAQWDLFYIERYANQRLQGGANAKVAEQIWMCDNGDDCYTSDRFINDNTSFLPFTQEVGNKEWNNGLIIIVLNDGQGGAIQFSHVYNK